MFTLHLYFLATLAIVSSSKCPEDPLACLFKKHSESQFFTSITLQESNEDRSTDETIEGQSGQQLPQHHHQHQHQHHQQQQQLHHQDGRFSLNDTQAAGCGGENQSSNATSGCHKCSKCPKNGKVLRSCSTSHDTICICERGTYLDILAYECKPCSPCPHGHGVWKKCNRHHDTVCRSCMPGFYSGVISNELGCSPCDKCTSNQIMLQECSRIENTVCIDRSIGKKNHFAQISSGGLVIGRKDNNSTSLVTNHQSESLNHQNAKHPHPGHNNNGGGSGEYGSNNGNGGSSGGQKGGYYYDYSTSQASLHIYFAILVVIICCVFFYVLLKWRLHQMAKSAPFKSQFGNIYISKSIRPANLNSLYSPLPQNQHQQSPNSGFLSVNHQTLRSPSQGTPFVQIPKQEPPPPAAMTASDCYRLVASNSPAHRPVQLQQQQQQQKSQTPPHLVITWSEKRHKAKYHEATCYLNRPPVFDHRRHQRSSK